jgi:hypothetical protein
MVMAVWDQDALNAKLSSNFGIMAGISDKYHFLPGNTDIPEQAFSNVILAARIMVIETIYLFEKGIDSKRNDFFNKLGLLSC